MKATDSTKRIIAACIFSLKASVLHVYTSNYLQIQAMCRGPAGGPPVPAQTHLVFKKQENNRVAHLRFEKFPVDPHHHQHHLLTASHKLAGRSPAAPASHVQKADGNEITVIPRCSHAKDNLRLDEIKSWACGCNCASVKVDTMSPRRLIKRSRWQNKSTETPK